jgi:hypothetical protein
MEALEETAPIPPSQRSPAQVAAAVVVSMAQHTRPLPPAVRVVEQDSVAVPELARRIRDTVAELRSEAWSVAAAVELPASEAPELWAVTVLRAAPESHHLSPAVRSLEAAAVVVELIQPELLELELLAAATEVSAEQTASLELSTQVEAVVAVAVSIPDRHRAPEEQG